jgi:serine O-acetyltransferase
MINAISFYRVAHFFYKHKIPVLPKLIKLIIFMVYNSVVPYECVIGKNTKLGYGGIAVVIHKNCVIGSNCTISQNVTIGGREGRKSVPVIGDNVFIGAGAKVIGDIKVGSGAIIGANAVVIKDIPQNAVVAGVPAKIIKYSNFQESNNV